MIQFPVQEYGSSKTRISISPLRGGSLAQLSWQGTPVLYNDSTRRENLDTTLRESFWMGPVAGKLDLATQQDYGRDLPQHGFLRDVARETQANDTTCVLTYIHNKQSKYRSGFSYKFVAKQILHYHDKGLTMSLEIENTDDTSFRFATGHHSYRAVDTADKNKIVVGNITLSDTDYQDWIDGVRTICIPNPGMISLHIPGKPNMHIHYDTSFAWLWLWSEPNKDFVCIEPVTCNPEDFEQQALHIPHHTKQVMNISIAFD